MLSNPRSGFYLILHHKQSSHIWRTQYHTVLRKMAQAGSNTHFREKWRNIFSPKLLIEQILEKDFFTKMDIFAIFGPKTAKLACAQKWTFFIFANFFWPNQKV